MHDLVVKDDDLVVATHGRSLWILDDLQPIREFDATIASRDVHLFPVADADPVALRRRAHWGTRGELPEPAARRVDLLLAEGEGEGRGEDRDPRRAEPVVRTLSSTPREPMGSDDNEDPEDFKKAALPSDAGVQRAVWDLALARAREDQGRQDRHRRSDRRAARRAGPYTVRLTAAGKTLTAPLKVVAGSARRSAAGRSRGAAASALRVRDDISKLTDLVNQLRSVQEQLQGPHEGARAAQGRSRRRRSDQGVRRGVKKADAIEDKLHNPTAEVVYDILAMRGGARLYSRLAPLQMWAVEAEGPPTAGMTQVLAEQEKELAALEAETRNFLEEEVGTLNDARRG